MLLTWLEKGKRWLARCCFLRQPVSNRPTTSDKGVRGELIAYRYLKRKGYRIVARRYRSRSGEVDLIGWDGDVLAFIEVKYRKDTQYGRPEEAVNRPKQRQICRVARNYLRGLRRQTLTYRFDIVGIQGGPGRPRRFTSSRMLSRNILPVAGIFSVGEHPACWPRFPGLGPATNTSWRFTGLSRKRGQHRSRIW